MKTRAFNAKPDEVVRILANETGVLVRPAKPTHADGMITGPAAEPYHAVEAYGGGAWHRASRMEAIVCPFGVPGDTLYVRETWAASVYADLPHLHYKADHSRVCMVHDAREGDITTLALDRINAKSPWRASVTMPHWASRIDLEVTAVKVVLRDEVWHWEFEYRRIKP